ncbi:MAG: hypothetical protein ABEJ82_08330 [Haloplanus sp.]
MSVPTATGDELAGVVDLFGALTRTELERALDELAFKQGAETDAEAFAAAVDAAVESFYLVPVDAADVADSADGSVPEDNLLAPGPAAFPALPDHAEDLPHILDVPERTVDRDRLARAAERRLRAAAASAVEREDAERIERLLDVSYDLETWASVDASGIRDRLDDALAESE